jgi:uncharacterized protein (TIRG00374 family)
VTRGRWLQAAILLIVGLLILYGLLRSVHPADVATAIRRASLGWVMLGFLSMLGFIGVRSWRWQLILSASGSRATLGDATAVTGIGFGVNSVSPFKLGELLRIGMIAQRSNIGIGEAGATVVLERILDVLALLVLAIGAALLSGERSNAGGVWGGLALLSTISVVVGVAAYVMILNRDRTIVVVQYLSRFLPDRLRQPVVGLADSILRGLALLRSPRRFAATGLLSLLTWVVLTLGLVAYFRAVSPDLPLVTLYLALTLFDITQAISITPASVGTYEGLFVLVLSAFHAGPASALAAVAVISHVGTIAALLLAAALGLVWLRVNRAPLPVRAQSALSS